MNFSWKNYDAARLFQEEYFKRIRCCIFRYVCKKHDSHKKLHL